MYCIRRRIPIKSASPELSINVSPDKSKISLPGW